MKKILFLLSIVSLIFLSACSHNEEKSINDDIDLTNCASFFDGCNICSVQDGSLTACTMNPCDSGTVVESKCLKTVEELNEQKNLSGSDIE